MNNNKKTIFIISGPLGVGKTTVSKKVVDTLKEGVLIEGDTLLHALNSINRLSWEEKLALTWKNLASISRNLIKRDLDVVIDFVVEEELEWFRNEVLDLAVKVSYFVLLADESTIIGRLKKRGDIKYWDRSKDLLEKFKNDPRNRDNIVDTTGKSVDEVVEIVLERT